MKGLLSKTSERVVYVLFRLVESIVGRWSPSTCENIGEFSGECAYWLCFPYRRLVGRNLRIAFPDLSDQKIDRISREHFAALGRNFALSIRIGRMSGEEIQERVSYEGLGNLQAALAQENGCIVGISHYSTWEVYARLRPFGSDVPTGAVYQRLHNRLIDERLLALREADGSQFFARREGLGELTTFLRGGGILGILFDQSPGSCGALVPFFGRLTPTTNFPGVLSQRTGAPVVYTHIEPNGTGRWRVVFDTPITVGAKGDRDYPSKVAATLNGKLEDTIRERPSEWFWVHRRWKISGKAFVSSGTGAKIWPQDEEALEKLSPYRLIVRSPNPLGDACMALPAVRALKRGRPDVHLTVCCRSNLAPMWDAQSEVDEVIPFSKGLKPWEVGRLIQEKGGEFDAGVLLPNSFRAALELRFAGVSYLAGYDRYRRKRLLRAAIPELPVTEKPDPANEKQHHVWRYLYLVGRIGADIRPVDELLQIPPAPTPIQPEEKEIHIGICPGAEYGNAKRYPIERYAEAIETLREKRPTVSFRVSVYGSPNERPIGDELVGLLSEPKENRVGETSIAGLVEELRTCHFLATNDTGTMHLAAALGVPTVAIFGSTEPAFTAPIGSVHRVIRHQVDCSPCFQRECPIDYRCMLRIPPGQVVREMEALLDSSGER